MTPEVRAIAQALADAIADHKASTHSVGGCVERRGNAGLHLAETVVDSSGASAEPRQFGSVLCTKSPLERRPLNRAELEFSREITRRLRDFNASRYYARLRIAERRAKP